MLDFDQREFAAFCRKSSMRRKMPFIAAGHSLPSELWPADRVKFGPLIALNLGFTASDPPAKTVTQKNRLK
jgi:hypothetical protein